MTHSAHRYGWLSARTALSNSPENGRPITRIVKELSQSVGLVRENFTASLMQYANSVANDKADEYNELVKMCVKAGEPIHQHDKSELNKALQLRMEAEISSMAERAEAEAVEPDKQGEQEKVPA